MRALTASCVAALLACGSQAQTPEPLSDGRYQMGTVLQVTLYGAEPELLEDLFAMGMLLLVQTHLVLF